ncbi:hypothetical protein [Dyella telluris]|uniref:DoxX family protein n=1 Tax=Dyella telluris TaxID=2763498 RepID=A0A7G8Q3S5_9GAMM|nr:hypothetical protein [Dyella telluris]QNK01433.1 hypothetical protein H8F01_20740 [Dyella telluris]
MQRLFSMFPVGLPGVGLLCLRLAAALSLWLAMQSTPLGFPAMEWVLEVAGFLLVIGLATPVVASISVLLGIYGVIESGGLAWECMGSTVLVALALALLGPGGYSVDGRLFGRKSVVLNGSGEPPVRKP